MEAGTNITAAMFAAYSKRRTKAYLRAHRENPTDGGAQAYLRSLQGLCWPARVSGTNGVG
jgi:hypothetical protein